MLCTLAAAVLSMACIAIARGSRYQSQRITSLRTSTQARQVADGLAQRAIVLLRENPSLTGQVIDTNAGIDGAYANLQAISATQTDVQIFLYATSTQPAKTVSVDPTAL
ncbi:MAG: hypothetical protein AAGA03_00010 [Planctomycetota bacterium]